MKQTHTKQVEEVMQGCGEIEYFSNWNADYECPCNLEGKFYLCDKCKSILKGMQTAIQNELEFLESFTEERWITSKKHLIMYQKKDKRITDCKNAWAKIKEVLG